MNAVSDPLISYFDQNIWSAIASPEFAIQRRDLEHLVHRGRMVIPISPVVLEETQAMQDLNSRTERARLLQSVSNNQYFPPSIYIRDLELLEYLKTGKAGIIARSQLLFPHPFGGRSLYYSGGDSTPMSVQQVLALMDSKQWKDQASQFQEDGLSQFEIEVTELINQPTSKKLKLCKQKLIKKLISGQNNPVKSISRLLLKSENEVIELIKNLNLEKLPASMCYVYGEYYYCGAVNAKSGKKFNLADFEQLHFLPYLDYYFSKDGQLADLAQKIAGKLNLKVVIDSDFTILTRALRIPGLNPYE